ncbi:trypsin-like serine protease [Oligoflexia bacterium]|nr:trypsin-like serine protease [Oligoflexia bacterium]
MIKFNIYTRLIFALVSALIIINTSACGGGSSESSSGGSTSSNVALSTNACSDIGLTTRVINGSACGTLENSPVVRVRTVYTNGQPSYCTGTAITPSVVLTAFHCFIGGEIVDVQVGTGNEGSVTGVPVTNIFYSPLLREETIAGDTQIFNDFVVLTLAGPLNVPVMPILASRSPVAGDVVKAYGYGRTSTGAVDAGGPNIGDNSSLYSGETVVRSVTNNHIRTTFFDNGSGTCFGDSGGPLVVLFNGQPAMVGVLSQFVESGTTVPDCTTGSVSQYTNLQSSELLSSLLEFVPDAFVN